MDGWVHVCPLCGTERAGRSATVVDPGCAVCGGIMIARRVDAQEPGHDEGRSTAPPGFPATLGLMLRWTLAVALMIGAARIGADAGGAWLALTGVGVAALFLVPLLIPER